MSTANTAPSPRMTLEAFKADPTAAMALAETLDEHSLDIVDADGKLVFWLGHNGPEPAPKPRPFTPEYGDKLPARPTQREVGDLHLHHWFEASRCLMSARQHLAAYALGAPSHMKLQPAMARLIGRLCEVERESSCGSEIERTDMVRAVDEAGDTLHRTLTIWRAERTSNFGKPAPYVPPTLEAKAAWEATAARSSRASLERAVFELLNRTRYLASELYDTTGEPVHGEFARLASHVRSLFGRVEAFASEGADPNEAGAAFREATQAVAAVSNDWDRFCDAYTTRTRAELDAKFGVTRAEPEQRP